MKEKNSSWRYQAVYIEHNTDEPEKTLEFSICEVYLDKDDKLEMWTESRQISPMGDTIDELLGDLQLMIDDVRNWKPVGFNSLSVGMAFEREQ